MNTTTESISTTEKSEDVGILWLAGLPVHIFFGFLNFIFKCDTEE